MIGIGVIMEAIIIGRGGAWGGICEMILNGGGGMIDGMSKGIKEVLGNLFWWILMWGNKGSKNVGI